MVPINGKFWMNKIEENDANDDVWTSSINSFQRQHEVVKKSYKDSVRAKKSYKNSLVNQVTSKMLTVTPQPAFNFDALVE